ncbi:MAG: aminotransferase class III-fold pyridoxal phosphate-dependent enzyme [Pseudomonadota bacterium]
MPTPLQLVLLIGFILLLPRLWRRLQLSRAKHPSLAGHARMSRLLSRQVPFYEYSAEEALAVDGAPAEVVEGRRRALDALRAELEERAPETRAAMAELHEGVSDVQFTRLNRAPFQFRSLAASLPTGGAAQATRGHEISDLDGNWMLDVGGSYGVNLLGNDFYRDCIDRGVERARALGPVLGPYHPVLKENVDLLKSLSGLDEVSFHMSGTEAVMQAVRLARYHTGRKRLVMFCGAYHGWWDGVQPGVGNRRSPGDIFMLKEMSEDTLRVLDGRRDIACVLVNPLQALQPNRGAASDAMLIDGRKDTAFDQDAYAQWLRDLREVCTRRGIALIFDEVFLGFRLGPRGAQGFFGVPADLVTWGKTLGGGLPVGVLCGKAEWMRRFREDRPTDICFARGTFNAHPYVMTCMNEFLQVATSEAFAREAERAPGRWDGRFAKLNERLEQGGFPVRLRNMLSVATVSYLAPSRYHWLLQYYLRAEGLSLSWIGTERFIFSHDWDDEAFEDFSQRFLAAAGRMATDGWWWQGAPEGKTIRRQVLREVLARRFAGA